VTYAVVCILLESMRFILHVFANVNSIISALCEALDLIEHWVYAFYSTRLCKCEFNSICLMRGSSFNWTIPCRCIQYCICYTSFLVSSNNTSNQLWF